MAQKIKEHIAIKMQALDPDSIRQIQQLGKPSSLIEGIDYTINDQGFFVFSAWYLLRQGKCCGNGCTNCPYQNLKKV
ncbi:hypothetical protein GCM10007049_25320 [Echinicola pacifica]|uniref:Uncharacterized protein n=1 Tax=Echinicola pacifica TaxID=346377 RepID=A0A918Q2A0_9BACT|nr:hypothetical protein GCM10007049_25320 [Echinicola pacifica]